MNRLRVRAGSALFALIVGSLALASPARAQGVPDFWFAGTRLIFDHAATANGEIAVGTTDEGLARLLRRTGATLAYQPGQRYVVITTADRRTISFTLGVARFSVEGATFRAPFAPYASDGEAFVPLYALAKALYVMPVTLGTETVLQPQLGSLDVRNVGNSVVVTLRGATPLHYRRTSTDDAGTVELLFTGVASTLDPSRIVGAPGLSQITLQANGTPRSPSTSLAFYGPAGGVHVLGVSHSPNELTLVFAPPGTAFAGDPIPSEGEAVVAAAETASPTPMPASAAVNSPDVTEPTPAADAANPALAPAAVTALAPAVVTALDETSSDQGTTLRMAVTGAAAFEWHRLLDNRWYIDIRNATLAIPSRDELPLAGGVSAVRLRQLARDPVPIVRLALTLDSTRPVDVTPSETGVTLTIGTAQEADTGRSGAGQIGAANIAAGPTVGPVPPVPSPAATGAWKFAPRSRNPRLIVIDPGHGGSDAGAQQNGLVEKDITLDLSQRLRTVLVARGWSVKLTRQTDVDVFEANDSAHDELQARCDVANDAGARMFISIHVNSFTSSSLNGTTTYYYKSVDLPLAQAIQRRLIAALDTKDDGVRKDNFYVIHHTTMPAILIETAFMSNPDDAALLRSPAFLQKVVLAVADGVGDYAGAPPPQTSMDAP